MRKRSIRSVLSIDAPGKKEGGYALWTVKPPSIQVGTILFSPARSEAEDLRTLWDLVAKTRPSLVIIERPFLFQIAENIGGLKMICARLGIHWWQVGPSKSKKLVFGRGRVEKTEVLQWAKTRPEISPEAKAALTQHQADAVLYLISWMVEASGKDTS